MLLRCGEDAIIIDAGMGFPKEEVYGVDIAIPDFNFLEPFRNQLLAVILTHGHEDHIGALAYLLKQFNIPVYASRFTIALTESRLEEHGLLANVLLHRVEAGGKIELGSLEIEFIHVTHSLVNCFALAITTPVGTIIHTGDYKIDETPVIGRPTDLASLRRYGERGVLALFADSTNSTIAGRTPSEREVIPAFEEIFTNASGRIIVSTFSSSIHRLQVVFDVAAETGRKVCVLGRSMVKNIEIADRLGVLKLTDGIMIAPDEVRNLLPDEVVLLVTGSQGEPRAVLPQMATGKYKGLVIEEGDTVIISARIIPGNERVISKIIGEIYKRGGNIFEEKRRTIHVSGHASQEDMRIMIEAVRPKYLIPIHGEYRMLYRHREYARNHLGFASRRVILIEDGDHLELDKDGFSIINKYEVNRTFIAETGFEEISSETVRERKKLAYEGIVTAIITLESKSRKPGAAPEVATHGLRGPNGSLGFSQELRRVIGKSVDSATSDELRNTELLKEKVRLDLKRFIQKQNGARPVIIPVVIEV